MKTLLAAVAALLITACGDKTAETPPPAAPGSAGPTMTASPPATPPAETEPPSDAIVDEGVIAAKAAITPENAEAEAARLEQEIEAELAAEE